MYYALNIKKNVKEYEMATKYVCDLCGFVYDPAVGDANTGIAPGTAIENVPKEWVCPLCGAEKENFVKVEV